MSTGNRRAPDAPVDLSDLDAGLVDAYLSRRLPWATRAQGRNVAERLVAVQVLVEAHGLARAGALLGTTERTVTRWHGRTTVGAPSELDADLVANLRAAERRSAASPMPCGRVPGGTHSGSGVHGVARITRATRAAGNRQLGDRSAA